jgi:predicted nucleotidyltransferase
METFGQNNRAGSETLAWQERLTPGRTLAPPGEKSDRICHMRRNDQLINSSRILATIVERIETTYAEDISLLICYGSYVTGSYGERSDIDFFFVPKTERGYQLGLQFILDDIGYDLWPVSWERLAKISNLEEQIASILMDGEVLFASSEDDLLKLEDLQGSLQKNLKEEAVARKMSLKYLDRAKTEYFDMQSSEGSDLLVDAIQIAETLLFAIAILNGTYTRKGLKRLAAEFHGFSIKPAGFLETYRRLMRTNRKAEVQHLVHDLIVGTEEVWKARFEGQPEPADSSDLAGFYEEFKSTYNKLLLACEEKNYENAWYAAFMVDRETTSFLARFTGPGIFPAMLEEVFSNDYETLRAKCMEHERKLLELLKKNQVNINIYRDMDEFRKYLLGER